MTRSWGWVDATTSGTRLAVDNSKGSALLFKARAGCLRTRSYKARYGNEEDARACFGKAKETMEHVFLECEEIKPGVCFGTSLNEFLGFRDYQENLNGPAIENSKRGLEDWWQKSREKEQRKIA